MNRKWALGASALLIVGSALSGCYDDRPGRHGPPRHDRDRDRGWDRDRDRDRPGWNDGRPDRPGNGWGDGRPDRRDRYR